MADPRVEKFAKVLVQYCTRIQPGDRVLIEATTAAEPLVREIYLKVLEAGGHPVPLLQLSDMFYPQHEDLLTLRGNDAQLDFVPPLQKLAYDQFESRIRIHSTLNTRSQTMIDPSPEAWADFWNAMREREAEYDAAQLDEAQPKRRRSRHARGRSPEMPIRNCESGRAPLNRQPNDPPQRPPHHPRTRQGSRPQAR